MRGGKRKRILHIVEAMGGGVFTYIVDLANGLCDEFDVVIAYATRPQTPVNYAEYFDKRVKLLKVKSFVRSINPLNDLRALIEIKKIAEKVDPDIIHLHSSKAGILGRVAFSGKRIPSFYTPHGYSFLMEDCSALKRFIYKGMEQVASGINKRCTTIACSKGEYLESKKLTKNSAYVNNGIDVDALEKLLRDNQISSDSADTEQLDAANQSNSTQTKNLTVFTLGRICYQKNPKMFNEIAETVAKKNPTIRFLWIGDGELRHELRCSNIHITGWVDRKEALKYSMESDIFMLSSLWEGLPISLLEAMYMKKLCIVSNVIGNRDVIESETNGWLCETKEDFVEAVMKSGGKEDEPMISRAYQDVMEIYNKKEMVSNYKKIYFSRIANK